VAPPAGQIRPARYLLVFLGIVVVLYALVFGTGNHKPTPKLGIDLKGGTTVTLTAHTLGGSAPPQSALTQAQQIIKQRVNGLGVSGAQVQQQGQNLVITVPGNQGREAKSLGATARLFVRPVVQDVPAGAQAPSQPGHGRGHSPKSPKQPATPPSSGGSSGANSGQTSTQAAGPTSEASSSGSNGGDGNGGNGSVTPAHAKRIRQAKKVRQNPKLTSDKAVQQKVLAGLRCSAHSEDPLAGYADPGKPLATCNQDGTQKFILAPSIIKGTQIASADAGVNQRQGGWQVNLSYKPKASSTWAHFTAGHVGKQTAFTLDSQVVSAPAIREAIPGGNTQISGNFSEQEAKHLANVLKYGTLPLTFTQSNVQTVSATLGLTSLKAGLIAGALGLALVFIYCLFYYRALGLLTMASLALSAVLVYAVLVLLGRGIGYSLDLAGVAGFIIAIGITADSFVVFFERLKDEVREGRSFRSAVPRGWVSARRTILSADGVSFLAAAVLYVIAVGDVQGFAFTLGMSTVLDLVVVFLVTHPLVVLASRNKTLSKPSMSGLGAVARIGRANRAQRARAAAGTKESSG
jgi:preprotein translocase subunit SecD